MTLARRFTPGTGTVMLAMGMLSIAALADPVKAGGDPAQIHQDFSTDPHWEGARNRLPATFPPRVMHGKKGDITDYRPSFVAAKGRSVMATIICRQYQ